MCFGFFPTEWKQEDFLSGLKILFLRSCSVIGKDQTRRIAGHHFFKKYMNIINKNLANLSQELEFLLES